MTTREDDLVWVDVSDESMDDATRLVGERLHAAATRDRHFAAVVTMPTTGGVRTRQLAGVGDRVRLLRRLRPELRRSCLGLAFVASAEMQRDRAKAFRAGEKMWGCATFATDDPDEARAWALSRLDVGAAEGREG